MTALPADRMTAIHNEITGWLRTHRHLVGGEFSLVSLMESLGHDARDWSGLSLDFLYDHWLDSYLSRLPAKQAQQQAHLTAAHRAGWILRHCLENSFSGKYDVTGRKGVGRFGGPTHYRWKEAEGALPRGSLANP